MPDLFDAHDQSATVPSDVSQPETENPTISVGEETPQQQQLPQTQEATTPEPSTEHSVETTRVNRKYSVRNPEEYASLLKLEGTTMNPMAAFHPLPPHVRFSTQASQEVVLLLLRQHPVTQLGWIIVALIAGFIPLLFTSVDFFELLPMSYRIGIVALWYLGLFGFIFESFIKWFYNVYVITDERIVDIDFHSLTFRDISAAAIDKIEDTTASTAGLLSALFDYGTVSIQTAAEKREFEFEGIPHPSKVTSIINDLIIEEEREKIEGRVN